MHRVQFLHFVQKRGPVKHLRTSALGRRGGELKKEAEIEKTNDTL